jgi:flagella basal body P-ring formation protein FlgA
MNRSKQPPLPSANRRPVAPLRAAIAAAAGMALLLPASLRAGAAEFRLRNRCEVAEPVVTLADVAEILAPDPAQRKHLAAIELFPAPLAGQTRFVRQREIEDLLALRGVNLLGHHFSGAGQVQIARRSQSERSGSEPAAAASVVHRAARLLREAIVQYLAEQVSKDEPWSVEVQLDARHAEAVSAAGERISVSGGAPPWTGQQQFEVTVESPKGPARFSVAATVTLPPAVAVTLRSLARGAVVQPGDVGLQRGLTLDGKDSSDVFHSIDDLLGSETTRAIPAGKVVEHAFVRPPLLVHRGQVVTVYAKSAGIRVRTTARAREDGSLGDLVAVESLLDRTSYFVRVCGIREVEVYARSIRTGQDRSADEAPARRKGDGARLCEAPSGPSRQMGPAPFSRADGKATHTSQRRSP